jgi:hypothetical protein
MNETPNTTPSPQALGAANAIKSAACYYFAFGQMPDKDVADIIEKHCQSAALAASLNKVMLWASTLHKAHGLLPNGPCMSDIREAQALLKSIQ